MANCIVCREAKAEIRDRNRPTDKRLKVCRTCHVARLKDDLREVLRIYQIKNTINTIANVDTINT